MKAKDNSLKKRLFIIIFESNTWAGKAFDLCLLIAIIMSVLVVMLESVSEIRSKWGEELYFLEWLFTLLFLVEYLLRVWITERRLSYIFSFFGVIDLLSILPTFLSLFMYGAQTLLVLRSIRLLRVFRILKMVRFLGEASQLGLALRASRHKIIVFIGSVTILVVIFGTIMYLVEGRENGFTSIPRSIYWAIVTLTTVGYGDIAPQTILGQFLASLIMILGYGIIAVPTGIVTSELTQQRKVEQNRGKICITCKNKVNDKDANYCKICGGSLSMQEHSE